MCDVKHSKTGVCDLYLFSIQPGGMEMNKMREEMLGGGETERQSQPGHDQTPPFSHQEQSADKQKKGKQQQTTSEPQQQLTRYLLYFGVIGLV